MLPKKVTYHRNTGAQQMSVEDRTVPDVNTRQPRPTAAIEQSPTRGRRLETLGWVAVTLGAVGGSGGSAFDSPAAWLTMVVVGIALTVAGVWAIYRGRQHSTPVLGSLRELTPNERIVLFLRSFNDDSVFAQSAATRFRGLGPALWSDTTTAADVRTEEQQIAAAVAPFGRMVALGSPDDSLPALGAARAYASDDTWRSEVFAALGHAECVVLAAGSSRNLAWEVDQVVRADCPARLVLTVGHDQEQYARFRNALGSMFPRGLPAYPAVSLRQRLLRARSVRAVIWFDNDWTPHMQVLAGWIPFIGFAGRTQRTVRRSLGNVFRRAGLPTRVTPTIPRPAAVPVSITLLLSFYSLPLLFAVIAIRLFEKQLAGWVDGGSDARDLLSTFSGILFLILASILLTLGVVLGIWAWRMWRGGPLAITLARVWGVSLAVGMCVSLLGPSPSQDDQGSGPVSSSSSQQGSSDATEGGLFDDEYTSSPSESEWDSSDSSDSSAVITATDGETDTDIPEFPELLPLIPLLLCYLCFPLGVSYLLTRRDVREWVDSRL